MFKQNLGFGVVTLITVVASGLFAACGADTETPDSNEQPSTTGTGTMTSPPATTSAPTGTGTMPTQTGSTTGSAPSTPVPTMSATTEPPAPAGDAVEGKSTYTASGCNACHGMAGEGGVIGPNVTGSMTAGIGSWTYAEFAAAVRVGTDPRGGMLCGSMTKYSEALLSEDKLVDIYAYLVSEMNDTAMRGACP